MIAQIMPAQRKHAGAVAAYLPEPQRRVINARGHDPRRVLRQRIIGSDAWVALIDGETAAVWGVEGTLLAPSAYVWLAVTPRAKKLPVLMVRTAKAELAKLSAMRGTLVTAIETVDKEAIRFAEFLGFRHDEETGGQVLMSWRLP